MKKTFIIVLVALATVLAIGCKKEDNTFKLPGTSWAYDLETTFMGTSVVVNDTLNIVDDKTLQRNFHFSAVGRVISDQVLFNYTWDGAKLVLLDSVGEPTNMVLNYRESDTVFYRELPEDDEMSAVFGRLGVTEVLYKRVR